MSKWNLNKITSETGYVSAIQKNNEVEHKDITKFHSFEFPKDVNNFQVLTDISLVAGFETDVQKNDKTVI